MRNAMVAAMAVAGLSGCVTQFFGAPRVKDGPAGCRRTCDEWQMELVGMVKMGEYSDGCICQVRGGHVQMQQAAAAAAETQTGAYHRETSQTTGYRPGNPLGRD